MNKGATGQASVHINASPEELYALVSDVTRMGEWSPETVRCQWLGGATGPAVGARFKGSNRRGIMRWSTKPRVTAAEPGREFAFVAGLMMFNRDMTKWRYQFEPAGGGTDVTESFEILKIPGAIGRWFTKMGTGLTWDQRPADMEAGMRTTLERLKAAAESG